MLFMIEYIKVLIFAFANLTFLWLNYNMMNKLAKIRGIKERKNANDIFQTPLPVALKLIEMAEIEDDDTVLDPCRGDGIIYNNLPDYCQKEWAEILDGRDFLITMPQSISSFLIHLFLFTPTGLYTVLS